MSVRRRRVRERVERERQRVEASARFTHSMECMRRAIDDGIARGETTATPRVMRDLSRHLIAVRASDSANEPSEERP